MKIYFYFLILLTFSALDLQAFSISERAEMAQEKGWSSFFSPPLKKRHEKMAKMIFSVINTKEKLWKIRGTYPKENEKDLIFFLIPKDSEESDESPYLGENPWDELFMVHEFKFDSTSSDNAWAIILELVNENPPFECKAELIEKTNTDEFIYQKCKSDAKFSYRNGHIFGLLVKVNSYLFRRYQYYQRNEILSEDDKENLLLKFRKINELINVI